MSVEYLNGKVQVVEKLDNYILGGEESYEELDYVFESVEVESKANFEVEFERQGILRYYESYRVEGGYLFEVLVFGKATHGKSKMK